MSILFSRFLLNSCLFVLLIRAATAGESRQGWQREPDGRGTIGLVWSCLTTLFICVWAALHNNVPSKNDSDFTFFFRKLKWTFVSIIAPEMVTAGAFLQWRSARQFAQRMKAARFFQYTQTHGFFANMGGIIVDRDCLETEAGFTCDCYSGPVDAEGLYRLVTQSQLVKHGDLTAKSINDKSKADWFVKAIACSQALWQGAQCIARTAQGLPLSLLELATMAYVVCALANYIFWWNKPLDVTVPTTIFLDCGEFRSQADLYGQARAFAPSTLGAKSVFEQPGGEIDVRLRGRVPNDSCDGRMRMEIVVLPVAVFCIVFGGIHCVAWNFSFPSRTEQTLWHIASLVSTFSIPAGCALSSYLEWLGLTHLYSEELYRRNTGETSLRSGSKAGWFDTFINCMVWLPYSAARLYLVVEVFASLRSLPKGTYDTVEWTKFLPHITWYVGSFIK
ncbi:hypothetical protein FGG08_000318 [Glutinoglossum americanum]|uniref:Uncharacterized protein n=1 Tax=Glutinoglossum americanum TaxID=1670608 RepID=A0A9P8L674_9PEZI|nr:hypothetical protein FGG08_000318 [Glutinoglossum americanum]